MTNTLPFMKVVDICECKHNRMHATSMMATPRGRDRLFFLTFYLCSWFLDTLGSLTQVPDIFSLRSVVQGCCTDEFGPVIPCYRILSLSMRCTDPTVPMPHPPHLKKKGGGFEGLVDSSTIYAPLERPMDHDLTEITGSCNSCCYLSWIIRHYTFECLKLKKQKKKHSLKALHFWKKVNSVILLEKSPRKHNSQPLSHETLKNVYDQR